MKFADWGFTFPETPLKPNKTMSHGDSISFETDIKSITYFFSSRCFFTASSISAL